MSIDPGSIRRVRRPLSVNKRALFGVLGVLVLAGGIAAAYPYRDQIQFAGEEFIARTVGAEVKQIMVEGVTHTNSEDLSRAIGLKQGDSLVGFDAGATRARLEDLPWVRLASVRRELPSTLRVHIYEYKPLATIEQEEAQWVVDKDGHLIVTTEETLEGLPLLAGDGAGTAAAGLFALLGGYPKILQTLASATYVGKRRWDIELTSGVRVQLPEENMANALDVLLKLDKKRQVLSMSGGVVDLRIEDRVVLRLPEDVRARRKETYTAARRVL